MAISKICEDQAKLQTEILKAIQKELEKQTSILLPLASLLGVNTPSGI